MAVHHRLNLGIFLICWRAQPTYTEQHGLQALLAGGRSLGDTSVVTGLAQEAVTRFALVTPARVGILLPYLLEQQFTKRECHSKNRQGVAPALEHCRGAGAANLSASLHAELDCGLGLSLAILSVVMHVAVLCDDWFPWLSLFRGPAVYMPGTA